jgi:hypothetical protein
MLIAAAVLLHMHQEEQAGDKSCVTAGSDL